MGSFAGRKGHPDENVCISGLSRNLDFDPDISVDPANDPCHAKKPHDSPPLNQLIVNEVFPFEVQRERLDYIQCQLKAGKLKSLVIHLAEGNDASARREFRMLSRQSILMNGLIIVHATALTPADFLGIKEARAGIVWSPRSNDELYGSTMNIAAAKLAGVPIALAPDWSPTGSAGMIQELNYAASKYPFFTAAELLAMATSNPAKMARLDDKIGRLQSGLYADFLVIRKRGGSPYDSVVSATPADIRLVVVNGQPVYGDPEYLEKLLPNASLEAITVCGVNKEFDLSGADRIKKSWTDIQSQLAGELHRYGVELSTIECN